MAHILSNTTAEMMQMICRFHTRRGGCDEDCPLRCICTEMVKDWPVVESEVTTNGDV